MAPQLVVLTVVPPSGAVFHCILGEGQWIGRDATCTIVVDDEALSGRHVVLEQHDAALVFRDPGSTNGTWEGTHKRERIPAASGQSFRVGSTHVRVVAITTASSTVLELRPSSEARWTTQVVRLPTLVDADDRTGLDFSRTFGSGDSALLYVDDGRLQLVLPVRGQRAAPAEVVSADADGLFAFGGIHFASITARGPVQFATDLTFGPADELRPARDTRETDLSFPSRAFHHREVDLRTLQAEGLPIEERKWLALGGGIGSFVWVNALRVHGVAATDIGVVGFEDAPYARYRRLCRQSQIPDHERLRSNSESCPDNFWGFPGYGLRESWGAFKKLRWGESLRILAQLTNEPDRSATYTPRAGDVFASMDREAARIGWADMLQRGRIRAIRKTTDGRYVVAVSSRPTPDAPRAYFVAPVVHIALGYPGVQFLDDLREYRERTHDFRRVVNAYEDHDTLYEQLARDGGVVVLRGRGIVASRVLQRLYEEREKGARIRVVHLMRTPRTEGSRAGTAQRFTENHWEFQPFNWPEACWGGDLRGELEAAAPTRRQELLGSWGGTTTADRPDWRKIVASGLEQGWYGIVFGTVEQMQGDDDSLNLLVRSQDGTSEVRCDAVIDATGLVSSVRSNPVLADLLGTYDLPRNPQGRLEVTPEFELEPLRNEDGRVFVAGVATLGSIYAPVDSFLGLQYSALASLNALARRVRPLGPIQSFQAWTRWATGAAP